MRGTACASVSGTPAAWNARLAIIMMEIPNNAVKQ
jgi:hypothetical protein